MKEGGVIPTPRYKNLLKTLSDHLIQQMCANWVEAAEVRFLSDSAMQAYF
jgi:hypothetical protein